MHYNPLIQVLQPPYPGTTAPLSRYYNPFIQVLQPLYAGTLTPAFPGTSGVVGSNRRRVFSLRLNGDDMVYFE